MEMRKKKLDRRESVLDHYGGSVVVVVVAVGTKTVQLTFQ
jgi:hypothetical protein